MASDIEVKNLLKRISEAANPSSKSKQNQEFWQDSAARLLVFIDETIQRSDKVNAWTPRDYSKDNLCVLASIFHILANITGVNDPFRNKLWTQLRRDAGLIEGDQKQNMISFYELAYSRFCSYICQLLGDRFGYVQKLLIKNIFDKSDVCSLFASDVYAFIFRIVHPTRKMSLCQIIMNLCKLAPPESVTKGAALINRLKNPVINFENPKYQYILDF